MSSSTFVGLTIPSITFVIDGIVAATAPDVLTVLTVLAPDVLAVLAAAAALAARRKLLALLISVTDFTSLRALKGSSSGFLL